MYFINFSKCNICKEKKSVALSRESREKICFDCDKERYENIAFKQKEHWISGESKTKRV